MNVTRVAVGFSLVLSAIAVRAEDPPAAPVARESATAPEQAAARPPSRASLDLTMGNVRNYMMPSEYQAAINAPDADKADIVVHGERPPPPLKSQQPVPGGIVAPFWMLANPLKAWRAFVPDPNAPPPGPPSVVPEREFRWGP